MANAAILAKAAATALTDERARKSAGWIIAAILSPVILVVALVCSLAYGTAAHNVSAAELCFLGGTLPADVLEEYRVYIEDMRESFSILDGFITTINEQIEGNTHLDDTQIKGIFYALYFGEDSPSLNAHQQYVDCFVTYEERTRTVTAKDDNGNGIETEEAYTVAVPIQDIVEIYSRISETLGSEVTPEQKANADSIYSLIRYGAASGDASWIEGDNAPFIGADGFCSPVGANWRSIVTSEFGYRRDPINGQTSGHSGMDLAVPSGTPVRAALSGKVTVATYHNSYGYYVMIDHGNGLSTLYAHCSQLIARVGQTVQAGDVIARSGSTGRSTGPHLHLEVRVNGERTNPRYYLP